MVSVQRVSFILSLATFLCTSHTNGEPTLDTRIRRVSGFYAAHCAGVYEIPVELVEAVIEVESGWKREAVSDKGACGPMQLMPATAERFAVVNRFNIEQNIRAGVEYLARLTRIFRGDLRLALAAYVAGEGRILRRGLAYSCPEVVSYAQKVAHLYWKKRQERSLPRREK
jgi:soluble lytic murein transglycosylase-like protein